MTRHDPRNPNPVALRQITPGPPGPPPTVTWDGKHMIINGERSPDLSGPQGKEGPPGDEGPPGPHPETAWEGSRLRVNGELGPDLGSAPITFADWTPSWTSTGAAIGNGSLVGRFAEVGRFVAWNMTLTFGSDTDPGSTSWTFSLPVPGRSFRAVHGAGTIGQVPVTVMGVATGEIGLMTPSGRLSHANPGGYSAGTVLSVGGTYERNL